MAYLKIFLPLTPNTIPKPPYAPKDSLHCMRRILDISRSVIQCSLFIWALLLTQACQPTTPPKPEAKRPIPKAPQPQSQATTTKPDTLFPTHSEQEIHHFLDSIGRLNWHTLDDSVNFGDIPYPGFRKNKFLNPKQFNELKAGCESGKISKDLAKFLHPDKLDEETSKELQASGSFPIHYEPIDKNQKFGHYAITINTDDWWGQDMVAFFDGNHLVETHDIFYRYRLEIGSFVDTAGRRFVWYDNCHGSGAGVAQFHRTIYLWEKSQFLPALEILEVGNMGFPPRRYELDSEIFKTDPLALKFTYKQFLPDPNDPQQANFPNIDILDDSTIVPFEYDPVSHHFKGNWSASKLHYAQMLTYTNDENDLLFVNTHHRLLKKLLDGTDKSKHDAVAWYLDRIMNGDYPKGNDKR